MWWNGRGAIWCIWFFLLCGIICNYLEIFTSSFPIITTGALLIFTLMVIMQAVHETTFPLRVVRVILTIFCLSMGIEILGVHTGWPFGEYEYNKCFFPQLAQVPFVIGASWVMVVVCSWKIAIAPNWLYGTLQGGILVLLFDIALEPAAKALNLWQFATGVPPLQNYISWGVLGALFCGLLFTTQHERILRKERSSLYLHLYSAQIVYFLSLA
jgi:uncharacterized membrane protein